MMSKVLDLDVLRPEPVIVKLGGHEIDVSFVPTGLTFDISEVVDEMRGLDQKAIAENDPAEVKKAFDLSVKLCSTFCSWRHPDMDDDWFRENTNPEQLRKIGEYIRAALNRAFEGIDSKN